MVILVVLAFSDAPYLTFPPPGFSLRWFRDYLGDRDWINSTFFSLVLATAAACITLACGFLASLAIVRLERVRQKLLIITAAMPLLISHMVIALAIFFVSAQLHMVGSIVMFVGTYALLGLPFVVLVMTAALRRFDNNQLRAAASLGATPFAATRTVLVPAVLPAIGSAFVFAFLAAFDDVTIALFMSTPSAVPLPMRIWDSLRESLTPRSAAVAVMLYGSAFAISIVVLLFMRLTRERRST
jgi:putative spermidine/putrescine transport system permease protein